MNKSEIEAEVLNILQTILRRQLAGLDGISRKTVMGWDSLKHIEIMFALEDHFRLEFSESQLADLDTLEKIVEAIDQHLSC